MTLAGSAVALDCDGQARRVGPLVLPNDVADFQVTQHSDVPSEGTVTITMK